MAKAKQAKMTKAQFFKELAKLRKNKWKVSKGGEIRCAKGDCPIVALGKAKIGPLLAGLPTNLLELLAAQGADPSEWSESEWEEAATAMGMDGDLASDLVAAADYRLDELEDEQQALRKKLEKTLLSK